MQSEIIMHKMATWDQQLNTIPLSCGWMDHTTSRRRIGAIEMVCPDVVHSICCCLNRCPCGPRATVQHGGMHDDHSTVFLQQIPFSRRFAHTSSGTVLRSTRCSACTCRLGLSDKPGACNASPRDRAGEAAATYAFKEASQTGTLWVHPLLQCDNTQHTYLIANFCRRYLTGLLTQVELIVV